MARIAKPGGTRNRAGRVATVVGLLVLVAGLLVGSDAFGLREDLFGSATPPPRASAFSRVVGETPAQKRQRTVLRSEPWWQQVKRLRGAGSGATPVFEIGDGALQWRLKWSCRSGHLTVRQPGKSAPLVDGSCPSGKAGYASGAGRKRLQVTADGPWQLQVEQQIDVPLDEPPLPSMSAPGTVPVATGSFYRIDQVGKGRVTIYRLANGRYVLRLRDFYVTPNTDLELRLSPLRAPHSTRQYTRSPSALVHFLDVTAGSLNFTVPRGVDPTRYGSVVLWCQRLLSAYAGASLKPAR